MRNDDPEDELLTEAQACELLGVDTDALHALVAENRVLQIRIVGGDGYPAFQFRSDSTPLPGLREVIEELCVVDDQWLWWLWLLAEASDADDDTRARWELLRNGQVETVVRAASRSAWAWRDIT